MLRIEEGKIYLTRGDTAYLTVTVDGREPQAEDRIILSVKKNIDDVDYAFQKTVSFGEIFVIMPEDTKDLEYGKYFYDVQLVTNIGEIFTVIEKTAFYVREEVTL